jgi:phage gp45-like
MIEIGIVKGVEFAKNKDGEKVTTLLQVQLSEKDDIQTVELYTQAGQESNPPIDSEVIVISLTASYKIGIALNDSIEPTMAEGEKKIYATDAGAIVSFINFLNTGIIELNGNTNFAVKFNELETAFNSLKNTVDTHVHSGVTTGPGTSGPLVTPSTADITPAKSTTVKL